MKKYFLTFATSDLNKSLKRIKKEAINLDFYDHIITYNEKDLDKNFKSYFKNYLKLLTNLFYLCYLMD